MKKARIVLSVLALCSILGGILAFKSGRRGLSNLFSTTSGNFTQNGASKWITYATYAPYRTFATDITQNTTIPPMSVYTLTTQVWTTIGGQPFFYTVVTGSRYPIALPIYDDEDQ